MHIPRRPAEMVEVDWAGDPAHIIDPDTGELLNAYLFVAALPYGQYTYVEAFLDEKTRNWIRAHVHMYEFFGGVTTMLVPNNSTTAVNHARSDWYTAALNRTYGEMAEHYGTAVVPARVRHPKDKASVEGNVGKISSWITAALRNEEFFSLAELNAAIRNRLDQFNARPFQKKECSRQEIFENEERPQLRPLPATPFEVAEWKTSTVQFNYHIVLDGMYYSVPYQYIKKQVESRLTDSTVEVYYEHERIANHARLVSLLCPGIFMAIIFHDYLPDFNASVGKLSILASCSISALAFGSVGFFMRSVFRVTSKYLFQLPFVKLDETFMPTTNLLLWKDSFYSKEKKQRIYDKIRMKYGIDLLPETVKRMKELDTRKKIAEAVSCIRIDFRRSEGDKRIVENCNIQIGMFRNYLGGQSMHVR